MKNYYLWLFVTVMLLGASSLKSAEIIPVWNKTIEEGSIQDMQLMPGGNEFMLTTSKGEIQIRSSENGELVRSHIDTTNLFMNGYFEFTPDSNRVVMCRSGLLQIIDINTFERLNYFAFGKDSVIKGFDALVIDPIRPYVYVLLNGFSRETGDITDTRSKVQVYNYETMKLVKDLTPYGEYNYTAIAVSDDGKYLATLNNGKAYLKVWDLETMEQIRNVQLWDERLPNSDWWCESEDIEFSKLNPDVIFYSGLYPLLEPKGAQEGIHQFTISTSVNTDDITKSGNTGKIVMFDNENRCLVHSSARMFFYNFKDKIQEFYNWPPKNVFAGIVRYSSKGDFFIGGDGNGISKFLFDRQTSVETGYEEEIIISPNPTDSFVNINIVCSEPSINYHISDTSGLLLLQSIVPNQGNNLQIDFSPYPTGIYFLTLHCNNELKTYKIIKEG